MLLTLGGLLVTLKIKDELEENRLVYHSIIINVKDNTNNAAIDINQRDGNTHQILFKLVDGNKFFNVSGYEPEISFYDEDTKTVVITSAVTILNDYRGYLSYTIGNSLLRKYGRYTVTLKLKRNEVLCGCGCSHKENLTFKFILNVVKSQDSGDSSCPCHNYEVAITKDFYDKLCAHLNNRLIHLSESDRIALNTLSDMLEYIVTNGGGWENDIVKVLTPREDFADLVQDIIGITPDTIEEINNRINTLEISVNEIENVIESLKNLNKVDKVSIERDKDSVMRIHDFGKYYWEYNKTSQQWEKKLYDDSIDFDLQLVERRINVNGHNVLVATWIRPVVDEHTIEELVNQVAEVVNNITVLNNRVDELEDTHAQDIQNIYNYLETEYPQWTSLDAFSS